jgi:hypothetical protein
MDSKNDSVLVEWLTSYCPVCQLQSSLFRRDRRDTKREGIRGKGESIQENLAPKGV